ncbi:MAG TPA: prolyl oligopeptidase family serine peptidase [Clostridiales bacterium]|nr:prolyl oligopeptidase family serine peptidase [Clostridiales bacterium]
MCIKRIGVFILVCSILLLGFSAIPAAGEESGTILPFVLRKTSFAFEERTDALIIDAGKEVIGSSLSISDFETHVRSTRKVNPSYVFYDGPREIIDIYTSKVNDVGSPSPTGRYIVIDFHDVGWGDGGTTNDGGYTFDSLYTVTFKGTQINCTDGSAIIPDGFEQIGEFNPVLDKFTYERSPEGMDYAQFLNTDAEGPLPLMVFFHGGGQGNDIYTPIRFSNGGPVWAYPENQAKYPCHVIAPRTGSGSTMNMQNVKAVIDRLIADGYVDPNRIYVTGFSMGGGNTWSLLNAYPELAAAAMPLCPAGGPNAQTAPLFAYLPLWMMVDQEDFLLGMVRNTHNTYGGYWNDYRYTEIPATILYDPPYNGWKFDGHSVWLAAYNEIDKYVEDGMTAIDWFFSKSKIRGVEEVQVVTYSREAPVLPGTVKVDVNYNASGIATEDRAVIWEEIDPQLYGNDGPGVFTVKGSIEGCVEKAIATVTVVYRNRINDLEETVTTLDINNGNKNALTEKLGNAEKFISQSKSKQAVNMLNAFINQVNAFRNAGKLTDAQAVELVEAARETIRNITD